MSGDTMSTEERVALYAAGPHELEVALDGLSESDLDLSIAPGEWTIRQILHHVADGEDIWSMAIKVALGAPGSTFAFRWYPGNDEWASTLDYAGRSVEPALALVMAKRTHVAQLLLHMSDSWEQSVRIVAAYDPEGQEMTAGAVVGLLVRHLAGHIEDIQKIREKHAV